MTVLVTGGAGYIGVHTCIELLQAGFDVVVLDNLSNASVQSLSRAERIVGQNIPFVEGDVRSPADLESVFKKYDISSVMHFAGLKAVGESVEKPLMYYSNNVVGTVCLCEVMTKYECKTLVFSSSATVYGDPASVPISEEFPLSVTNPYGRSKLIVEDILRDLYHADQDWSIGLLRYFNPVGAHESGLIGECPNGIPNNLMPFVCEVAAGKRDKLNIFGGDYSTSDGTGVRDYIHVVDLAKGHVKALDKLQKQSGMFTVNLGTGIGYSVLDMIKAFEKASGKKIPYEITSRRSGDVAQSYADPTRAIKVLNWKAELGLDRMCQDAWRWQLLNPNGYKV